MNIGEPCSREVCEGVLAGDRLEARGLDAHGAEPVAHQFTITDADGNADVELNFSFPLTRKRHALLEHMLEEGYSPHEAYVLILGGEILAHLQAIKNNKSKNP